MLELKHIHKTFGTKVVADNINLRLENGQLLAILGPSGCGKSTLLNIAAGLIPPDRGEIWLDGKNCTPLPPDKRRVGFMFQDYALLPHLNVWQNVAFGLKLRGISAQQSRQQAETMLTQVGLVQESERRIESLSGGEQQRVALARALIIKPRLLLLDEPFSSLDTGLRLQLREQTLTLIRQQHIPAILVTHDPEEAFAMANTMALMRSGQFIQRDSPNTILNRPTSEWAARLIGCLNVTSKYYIPQQALHFNHPAGVSSRLTDILRQPEYCRLMMQHPTFGEVWLNLAWPSTIGLNLSANSQWPLWIDENLVVYFN